MQKLTALLNNALSQTTFDTLFFGSLSAEAFKYRYTAGDASIRLVLDARATVADHVIEEFVQELRKVLGRYVDLQSDHVGNGLITVTGGSFRLTTYEYARILIRAAAILGAERVMQLLLEWVAGKPFLYTERLVLVGVEVDERMEINKGIYIEPLPEKHPELSSRIDVFDPRRRGYEKLRGAAMLSIEIEMRPVLYIPQNGNFTDTIFSTASEKIEEFSYVILRKALSLACNHWIDYAYKWMDYGDLQAFSSGGGGLVSYDGVLNVGKRIKLSQEQFEQTWDLSVKYHANAEIVSRLDIVVERWQKSKRPNASFTDRLIDLRIALEALCLKEHEGEMRFRLATYGAWYLGKNFEERQKYYGVLRKFYQLSSKVIHAGKIEITEDNKRLFSAAQDLCRIGILKRTYEDNEPNWNELILGSKH